MFFFNGSRLCTGVCNGWPATCLGQTVQAGAVLKDFAYQKWKLEGTLSGFLITQHLKPIKGRILDATAAEILQDVPTDDKRSLSFFIDLELVVGLPCGSG